MQDWIFRLGISHSLLRYFIQFDCRKVKKIGRPVVIGGHDMPSPGGNKVKYWRGPTDTAFLKTKYVLKKFSIIESQIYFQTIVYFHISICSVQCEIPCDKTKFQLTIIN